ncbi:Beta-1,3-galactosyltransferase 5 [Eumeta japonica]|uniref:Hexosyltransferase n=1 Tax=Eumeta variegata TaxID=151549 RepID=A0A4C1SUB2_EUMVA|nr:Beta-1,3-galactosyltransferase 5 [Eumeta japonica]
MLESQHSERMDLLGLHKVAILVVCFLFAYDYFNTTTVVVRVKEPRFTLLGPYNTVDIVVKDEYDRLIDLEDFHFKINTLPCKGYDNGLLLVIIVASNPYNVENRMTIRNTWGQNIDATKVIFLVGESDNATIAQTIRTESEMFKDIVQGNFIDAYRNMTYKHVMGLKWVAHHCPTARYILKTDDDVVVNSDALRMFLAEELSPWGAKDLLICEVFFKAEVHRKNSSKWMVTKEEYSGNYYPTYCAGWAVLYSRDVVARLLKAAANSPYFWIDDVHITGILAEQLRIPRTPFGSLVLSSHRANLLLAFGASYVGEFLLGPPDITVPKMNQIWKAIPTQPPDTKYF